MKIIALLFLIILCPTYSYAEQSGESEYQIAEKFYQENKEELERKCGCDEILPLPQKALDLYLKAGKLGHPKAQFKLGWMHLSHKVLPYNMEEGLKWWRRAAAQEYVPALINMAGITSEGVIVEKDYVKALEWYKKAAEKGDGMGQYYYGLAHHDGKGTEKDFIKSYAWISASIKTLKWDDSIQKAIEFKEGLVKEHLSKSELEEAILLAQKIHSMYVAPLKEKQ